MFLFDFIFLNLKKLTEKETKLLNGDANIFESINEIKYRKAMATKENLYKKNVNQLKSSNSAVENARKVLEEQHKKDITDCTNEFNAAVKPILEKYGCTTIIVGEFIGSQLRTSLQIVKAQSNN